jgi:hypothetical protein
MAIVIEGEDGPIEGESPSEFGRDVRGFARGIGDVLTFGRAEASVAEAIGYLVLLGVAVELFRHLR